MDALSPPQLHLCRPCLLTSQYDQDVRGIQFRFQPLYHQFSFSCYQSGFSLPFFLCVLFVTQMFALTANIIYPFLFSSFSIYPWDEKPWSWLGPYSSAKVWSSCRALSDIWVVQGREKVSLIPTKCFVLIMKCYLSVDVEISSCIRVKLYKGVSVFSNQAIKQNFLLFTNLEWDILLSFFSFLLLFSQRNHISSASKIVPQK